MSLPILVRAAATALIVGLLATPALALDPFEQARWQIAANQVRTTLLVPETPGFVLQRVEGDALTCEGDTLGEASASWAAPDGRTLNLIQGRPFACGDLGDDTLLATPTVSGVPARYSAFDTGAGPIWILRFKRDGLDLSLSASFDDQAALVAIAESMVPIVPSAGRAYRLTELSGQVVKTIGADTVVINADGRRQVVSLVGIRAPQPAVGGRRAGCRYRPARALLRRALPRGAAVRVATDPFRRSRDSKGRLLGYVSRLTPAEVDQYAAVTVQDRLLSVGAVRLAAGRYRYRGQFASSEREARRADQGLFGELCKGSVEPPAPPKPPPPPPPLNGPTQPTTPTGPGRSDAYNCDDFPLPGGVTAQDYLNRFPDDPSGLDGDGDGRACE